MRSISIPASPLAPGVAPVTIRYRDAGEGPAVVILHGGWGYEIYPFDRQIEALRCGHRVVIPDRSGYGGSQPIDNLPADFHERAAEETRAVIDALHLERPILWGHSDGAIIALLIGLAEPQCIAGAIVEATHLYKAKPGSRRFFEGIVANPESIGSRAAAAIVRDHGARWRQILELHSRAWLRIGSAAQSRAEDFYGGRLDELRIPVLVVHGSKDPRTEPGELAALCEALGRTHGSDPRGRGFGAQPSERRHEFAAGGPVKRSFAIFEDGGHSPHSERASSDAVTKAALSFVRDVIGRTDPDDPAGPIHPRHSPLRSAHD